MADGGVQAVVVTVVNVVGDADLRVGPIGKNWLLAGCKHLGFKGGGARGFRRCIRWSS